MMKLVEVVRAPATSEATFDVGFRFAQVRVRVARASRPLSPPALATCAHVTP